MATTYCPDCDNKIVVNPHPVLGQKLTCANCDAELEVISVDPLEVDWVYDWSWDEEDDDYDEDDDDW